MHKVLKPFKAGLPGSSIYGEDLVPGDERDFGDMAEGLIKEGYIEPVKEAPKKAGAKAGSAAD